MQHHKRATIILVSILSCLSCTTTHAHAIPVKVIENDGHYQLIRGGEPYEIKGAGLKHVDMGVFASHGGNSIRTWRTDNPTSTGLEQLDEALKHGVSVAMCIEIGRERLGFDYDDEAAVTAQLEYARGEVMKYKDHPALLTWIDRRGRETDDRLTPVVAVGGWSRRLPAVIGCADHWPAFLQYAV